MKINYKYILVSLIFLTLILSLSAVSAEDLDTIQQGTVSGGVDVVGTSYDDGSGTLEYEIPENVKSVDYAGLFIDSYTAGSSNLVYGSETNVTVTANGESEQIANERLVATEGSADGTVYVINDHTTKCFADYYMTYNLTGKLQNASGKVTINVTSGAIANYTYYNKIKLIGLVFAYNDGDNDHISYWVNSGSSWIKTADGDTAKATFNLGKINNEIANATLDNYALSSQDGIYTLNKVDLDESIAIDIGVYYHIHHKFDVTDKIKNGTNTLVYTPGEGSYSFRNVLSVLTIDNVVDASAGLKIASEYSGAAFAGTNNVIKADITNTGENTTVYIVDLYADGLKVNSTEVSIASGENATLYLADNNIRPVTENTVNGVNNTKILYEVTVTDKVTGFVLNQSSLNPTLWYNGNLGKDLAYPPENLTLFDAMSVNGGIFYETLDSTTYLASAGLNRTDVWNVDVPDDASFACGYIYVAYNWDKIYRELPLWNATFNGVNVTPVAWYRDQSNLGGYGKYGYGLVVYDVSALVQNGENTFYLEKEFNKTAVYPSTLVTLFDVPKSDTLTTVYMFNGADLLSNANNFLNRTAAGNNVLDIAPVNGFVDAQLVVFAAGAQKDEGNLVVNGELYEDIWMGTDKTVDNYIVFLDDASAESVDVSFVATGSTILALQQFVVIESYIPSVNAKLSSEYSNSVFAGTDNVLKLNLTNDGKLNTTYRIDFYVDSVLADSTEITLAIGENDVLYLVDETIRPVTEKTVNGADNDKVNYQVFICDNESGRVLSVFDISPSVLYNGYLGKDLAYPSQNISYFDTITVNGGVIIDTLDDTTYLGATALNRTDIWTINLDDAEFVNGFIYVAYNWDKVAREVPVWNATFNGVNVTPMNYYRDQSNLGGYGKYGYGLVVYDVSALVKNGENTFYLEKEFNKTAVYPSTFVAFYNTTESNVLTTVYMFNGADLLTDSYNFLDRISASNNVLSLSEADNLITADLIVFAAGAQKGEGDLIVDGELYENIWTGSGNSVNDYDVYLGEFLPESLDVSFVSTGSTIVALEQFVIIEYAVPSVEAKLSSEYSGVAYAGTDNVLNLNLTNNGIDNTTYVVDLYVDGELAKSYGVTVAPDEKAVLYLVDETIRPVTEKTVNGAENDKVEYTVIVSAKNNGDVLFEKTLTPSVLYNGNFGKDLEYPAQNISLFDVISINGMVYGETLNDTTYLGATALNRSDVWTIGIPEDEVIVKGLIYVPYNWDKVAREVPVWNTTFNGVEVTPVAYYRDQSNMGTYGKYGYGLVVYDVTDLLHAGENTFYLEKEFNKTAVYPSTLLRFTNLTDSDVYTNIYMFNGADLLSNANNFLGRTVASNSVLDIAPVNNFFDTYLYVFAASAQKGEGNLIVNGELYENVWNGSSNSVNMCEFGFDSFPGESINVSFVATGSTILALQQLVIVSYNVPSVEAKMSSEYSGVAFAGTENVIKLDLTNDGVINATYVIDFYVDGYIFNSTEVALAVGENTTLYLVDDIIRPVTEDTVKGADNEKVNYYVVIFDKETGIKISELELNPSVLYNGNFGKDLEYPAENITLFDTVTVNGGVILDVLNDSTYLGATATNRTDVWTIDVPDDAVFVNGFIYVAYNWDKVAREIPVWNTTFNGVEVTPVAYYRDQSNMGTYGKYGYGLVVYDVSDLLQKGENTFVLEKEFNKTAVYPSTFVAFYNVTENDVYTSVYMFNGADLLSNANNFLGRTVASNNILDIGKINDVLGAKLYVFAASAQAGEGNIILDGDLFENVWNGSANGVNICEFVSDSDLGESVNVSFVATGSTILALQQFVVVEFNYNTTADLQKLIDNAEAGSVIDLGSNVYRDVSNVNITKDLTITGGTITAKAGETIFNIPAISKGGPGEVNITGVTFVVSNADTIVLATADNSSDISYIDVAAINFVANTVDLADDDVVPESIKVLELDCERTILSPTNNISIVDNTLASGVEPFEFRVTSIAGDDGIVVPVGGNVPEKLETVIILENMTTFAYQSSIDGDIGDYFYATLKDSNGNPLANKTVKVGLNGKIYTRTTNETGGIGVLMKTAISGRYTFAVSFLGDDNYNASFAVALCTVNKQTPKLTTSSKTYKASAKTKTLSATLKTKAGNPLKGKTIKFTVNGKTYSATTNSKGVASVKVSLSKKGSYSFTVKYAGDSTYASVSKKATLKLT